MYQQEFNEVRINGTIAGYKRFLSSVVWKDLIDEMNALIAIANQGYQSANNMEEIRMIQGRVEAIEWLKVLPEQILAGLEETQKQEK